MRRLALFAAVVVAAIAGYLLAALFIPRNAPEPQPGVPTLTITKTITLPPGEPKP